MVWLEPVWDTSYIKELQTCGSKAGKAKEGEKEYTSFNPRLNHVPDRRSSTKAEVSAFMDCAGRARTCSINLLENDYPDSRRDAYMILLELWSYMGYFQCRPKSNKMEPYLLGVQYKDARRATQGLVRLIKRCDARLLDLTPEVVS